MHEFNADTNLIARFTEAAGVMAFYLIKRGDVELFFHPCFYGIGVAAIDQVDVFLVEGVVYFDQELLWGTLRI